MYDILNVISIKSNDFPKNSDGFVIAFSMLACLKQCWPVQVFPIIISNLLDY